MAEQGIRVYQQHHGVVERDYFAALATVTIGTLVWYLRKLMPTPQEIINGIVEMKYRIADRMIEQRRTS